MGVARAVEVRIQRAIAEEARIHETSVETARGGQN